MSEHYKCGRCESAFREDDANTVGDYVPEARRTIYWIACPHCGSEDVDTVWLCDLCEEDEPLEGLDWCARCIVNGNYPHGCDLEPEVIQEARAACGETA